MKYARRSLATVTGLLFALSFFAPQTTHADVLLPQTSVDGLSLVLSKLTSYLTTRVPAPAPLIHASDGLSSSVGKSLSSLTSGGTSFTSLFGTAITGFGLSGCTGASQALTWSGGSFGCHTISSGGNIATSTAETSGRVPFWTSTSGNTATLGADSSFVWDNTNKRLGIGTTTPALALDVNGLIRIGPSGGLWPDAGAPQSTTYVDNLIRNSTPGNNVMTIQSLANDGYSVIRAADLNGTEHTAWGWGNPGAGGFANVAYWESCCSASPTVMKIIQTWNGGNSTARMVFESNGAIEFNNLSASNIMTIDNAMNVTINGTGNLDVESTGGIFIAHDSSMGNANLGNMGILKFGASNDIGLRRVSAGLLEVNSGTSGVLRDLTLRSATTSGDTNLAVSGGNVGIGVTNPGQKLTVSGSFGLPFIGSGAGTAYLCTTLATGVVSSSTSACNSSSIRFKDNVQTLSDSRGLDIVKQLRPVTYTYKPNMLIPGNQVGFIAEEVYPLIPEVVGLDASGTPANLDYAKLTPVIVKAVQQLASTTQVITDGSGFFENLSYVAGRVVVGIIHVGQVIADKVTAGEVDTNKLCVGSTCVTEAEFQALLNQAGQSSVGGGSSSDGNSGTTTPPGDTGTSTPQTP